MVSIIVGVVLVIVGIVTWVGTMSVAHALAIFIGLMGILILVYGVAPVAYIRRQ
jgi:hypothetical protein